MKRIFILLLSVHCSLSSLATTYYVDAAQPDDSGDGTSWSKAKKTIQAAVNLPIERKSDLLKDFTKSTFNWNHKFSV